MANRFEYYKISEDHGRAPIHVNELDALGANEWELVAVTIDQKSNKTFFFKRPVMQRPGRKTDPGEFSSENPEKVVAKRRVAL